MPSKKKIVTKKVVKTKKPSVKKIVKKINHYTLRKTQRLNFREAGAPGFIFYSKWYDIKDKDSDHAYREAIKDFVQKQSNTLAEDSPESNYFIVSLCFGTKERHYWKSGKPTKPGQKVSIWSPLDSGEEDPGEIIAFSIIFNVPK